MLLCIFHSTTHKWDTAPVRFDPNKITDRQLWSDIRYTFRGDLQKPWRRIFGFMKVRNIVPIGYTQSGVPVRVDPKDYPDSRTFMHAYHHPEEIRTTHTWVDWFTEFDSNDERTNGLEFVEGLWADKLAIVAIVATVAMVAVCIVWCVLGGVLQTVFTVMSFVLTLVAAEIALAALYYQVALSGQ